MNWLEKCKDLRKAKADQKELSAKQKAHVENMERQRVAKSQQSKYSAPQQVNAKGWAVRAAAAAAGTTRPALANAPRVLKEVGDAAQKIGLWMLGEWGPKPATSY